jgi:hypothetical protein
LASIFSALLDLDEVTTPLGERNQKGLPRKKRNVEEMIVEPFFLVLDCRR